MPFDLPSQDQPADGLADLAFDEAVKVARRIRVLLDAGEHGLALQLYAESQALAVMAIELDQEQAA